MYVSNVWRLSPLAELGPSYGWSCFQRHVTSLHFTITLSQSSSQTKHILSCYHKTILAIKSVLVHITCCICICGQKVSKHDDDNVVSYGLSCIWTVRHLNAHPGLNSGRRVVVGRGHLTDISWDCKYIYYLHRFSLIKLRLISIILCWLH